MWSFTLQTFFLLLFSPYLYHVFEIFYLLCWNFVFEHTHVLNNNNKERKYFVDFPFTNLLWNTQNARCGAEQTQTVTRQAPTITHVPGNCWWPTLLLCQLFSVRAFPSLLQFSCVPFVRMICLFLTNNLGPVVSSKRIILLSNMENGTEVLQNKVNSILLCVYS